jgi:hypothetical protein
MPFYFPISYDEYVYLIHIILDIIGSQSAEYIQDVLMQGIHIPGQSVGLTGLAKIPQEEL